MVLILFGTDGLDVAAVQEAVKTITTGTLEYARGAARRVFFYAPIAVTAHGAPERTIHSRSVGLLSASATHRTSPRGN